VISRERRIGNMVIRAAFHDSLGAFFAPVRELRTMRLLFAVWGWHDVLID
jgi:hypothetical protein